MNNMKTIFEMSLLPLALFARPIPYSGAHEVLMKYAKRCSICLLVVVLASCASTQGPPVTESPKPRIALVLGGGAARGFAHIGVIRALEQEKIPIDMIVGTSVGSLIGAIYASDANSFELEWTAFSLEKDQVFDYGILSAFTSMGFAKGDKLEEFVKSKIPVANIEDLKLPFAAIATDLNRGTRVVLDHGSVAKAVHASSAIPGVFNPVDHQGKLLVDGGVVENLPSSVARERGADIVIAVDISENVINFNITNLIDVMLQSVTIMSSENVKYTRRNADVLITPAVGDVGMLDFSQKKRCMQAGIEAAQKSMLDIKKKIGEWERKQLPQK
jgi:NTE family protein